MFLQACVKNSVHGGGEEGVCLWAYYPPPPPPRQTHQMHSCCMLFRWTWFYNVITLVSSDRDLIVRLTYLRQHRRKMRDCPLQRVTVVIGCVLSWEGTKKVTMSSGFRNWVGGGGVKSVRPPREIVWSLTYFYKTKGQGWRWILSSSRGQEIWHLFGQMSWPIYATGSTAPHFLWTTDDHIF